MAGAAGSKPPAIARSIRQPANPACTASQCFRLGGLQQYFPLVSEAEFWGEIDLAEMARDASVLTTSTAEAVSLTVQLYG